MRVVVPPALLRAVGLLKGWRAGPLLLVFWPAVLLAVLPLESLRMIGGDEGVELTKAAHWRREGRFGEEVWNDQPLTHTRLYSVFLGVAEGASGPRIWSLLTSTLLLASIARFASDLAGRQEVGLWSAVVLGCSSLGLELSVSAMQEMPATAFGMLGVSLAARPGACRRPGLLVLAAMACAFGVAIKLTAALYGLAALAMLAFAIPVAQDGRHERARDRALVVFSGLVLGGSVALLSILDGRPLEALLGSHLVAFEEADKLPGAHQTVGRWEYPGRDYPQMLIWAFVGLVIWARESWRGACLRGSCRDKPVEPEAAAESAKGRLRSVDFRWMILPLLAFMFHAAIRPWWPYYTLGLWVALSPYAGLGVTWGVDRLGRMLARGRRAFVPPAPSFWPAIAILVLLGIAAQEWVGSLRMWMRSQRHQDSSIVAAIRRYAPAHRTGSLYASDATYAFWSGLAVPEELLVVTQKRFLSGDLRPEDIPRMIGRRACDFVLTPQGLDTRSSREWRSLLETSYVLVAVADGRELHAHRRLEPRPWRSYRRW